jgi:hypothetical protein
MSNDTNNSCCGSVIDLVVHGQNTAKCPTCGEAGIQVKNITVRHLVNTEHVNGIEHLDFAICMNENCDAVYFSLNEQVVFNKNQMKEPVWFKNDADPKYACYCSKITFEQVKEAVLIIGDKNMKEVIALTGAMKNCQCEIKNPLGICCHETIKQAMDEV